MESKKKKKNVPEAVVVEVAGVALEDAGPTGLSLMDDGGAPVQVVEAGVVALVEDTWKNKRKNNISNRRKFNSQLKGLNNNTEKKKFYCCRNYRHWQRWRGGPRR